MGRAANELGYHPRALLVRQLSRIACDIPQLLIFALRYRSFPITFIITPTNSLTVNSLIFLLSVLMSTGAHIV